MNTITDISLFELTIFFLKVIGAIILACGIYSFFLLVIIGAFTYDR